ncbi:kinase-like protein [Coprinopsis marcescibilis]|uniref:Kinase-like protein n=1 Tax=Coprinopsis marcescibilis TaxID=230819 RepID=A0A5C3L510_COPMA|nr:kinase-like protein [Coprinopsis marcescibilis]
MNLESQNRGNTKLVHLLLRLSKRYDSYPQCLVLRGVLKSGDQPLAAGHFGEVWKGQFLEQPICLKVVRLYQNSDAHRLIKAFSREAIIWSHLSHDNLLPFYGMYQLEDNSNRICLVSPWMDNGTLREHIGHNPRSNRLWLLSDVASGLAYLHEQSVTHGDLKGQNILVSKFGRACLADFGLSRATEAQTSHWGSGSTTHAVGTVRWQAPELFDPDLDNPKPTAASDVYSFSCVCYEAFTGEIPFYEYPRDATVIAFVTRGRRPTKPSPFSHGLTMDFWTLMEMCWSSEPSKRPIVVQVLQQPVFRELEDNRPEGQAYILSLSQFRRSVYGGSQSGRGLSSWLKW